MATPTHLSSGYDKPPQNILDVMRVPNPPQPYVSPTGEHIALVHWQLAPSIERMATPFLRLAGIRIEPHNHSKRNRPGGHGIAEAATHYDIVNVLDGTIQQTKLPEGSAGARLSHPFWNANGKLFAVRATTDTTVELWIGSPQTGDVRRVPGVHLNETLDHDIQWMPDQTTLLVKLVPNDLGPPPQKSAAAITPITQETEGKKGKSSTYEVRDPLTGPHDEDAFDYYASSQLAFVDADSLHVRPFGEVDRYAEVKPSPNGEHVLVSDLRRPYSYITSAMRFPRQFNIWSVSDQSKVSHHELATIPLCDRVPIHGVRCGPRQFCWIPTAPATLVWVEALDDGGWQTDVPARDKIMMLEAPFTTQSKEVIRLKHRFWDIHWTEHKDLTILMEHDRNKYWRRSLIISIDHPEEEPNVLFSYSIQEKYKNPGVLVKQKLPNGYDVLRMEGDSIFLSGPGSSPDGDRPFLDRLNYKTRTSERPFRSEKNIFERFVAFDPLHKDAFITWRQSQQDPPNVFRRILGENVGASVEGEADYNSEPIPITHMPDPAPIVRQIKKRLIKYKRKDGLDLSFTLLTPPDYQEGVRLPTIIHAYPLDHADASTAGQTTGSDATFTRLAKFAYLVLAGYAVVQQASFPIIGDPRTLYDTYLEQLIDNAEAAVEEVIRLGVADPNRIGVTGHSHGALMTANLLAHTSLFRAGVATSGAYNKMFTAFGFQNERRSVWEAQDAYIKASPHLFADKIQTPLLLMHGADDANAGTRPFQSNLLYEGIRGNGGTARLVILPHEPHWYTAQESNEQLVYEMLTWFDKHVKNQPARL